MNDESVEAMDERGSDIMLGTLLDGTLKYEDARLPTVDMDDLSAPESRMPSELKSANAPLGMRRD